MKRLLLVFSLGITLSVSAHQTDTIPTAAHEDTIPEGIGAIDTNSYYYRDPAFDSQSMRRNIETIYHLQQENRAKQKKAAMTRIIFGVAMFAVLVVGLMRKKKTAR